MKRIKKQLFGYVAVALVFMMIGAAATHVTPSAQAENVTTVIHTSPFTAAVAEVKDSVVGINNYQIVRYANYGGWMWGPGRNYEVMEEEQLAGSGSGVVISTEGHILTNYHVVEDAVRLAVTVNGEEHPAALIAVDETLDIAIVQVPGLGLEPVVLGDSDALQIADWAICIGNPLGFTGTTTVGIISALNREVTGNATDAYGKRATNLMIQTDAAINSGNSGGGMFNVAGELIGIPSLKYSSSSYSGGASIEGIGMAIPINVAKPLIEDVLNGKGNVQSTPSSQSITASGKPRIGVSVSNMNTNHYAVAQGLLPNGAYISAVEEGSPAEKAGIQVADIVVEIDGNIISNTTQMTSYLQSKQAGDVVKMKVYRVDGGLNNVEGSDIPDGEYIDLEVKLEILDEVQQ